MSILKFQSTHLHEVWLRDVILHKKGNVSIHTPTWGVTPKVKCTLDLSEVSIHTPTWGVTIRICPVILFLWSFNPHTYMRCDLFAWIWGMVETSFNPHTYMRCDNRGKTVCWYDRVSIHTPTWGVTANSMNYKINQMFQSTHLHEVWPAWKAATGWSTCFNPHTYMRCDRFFCEMSKPERCFNPHTYMRCDQSSISSHVDN